MTPSLPPIPWQPIPITPLPEVVEDNSSQMWAIWDACVRQIERQLQTPTKAHA